jgi:hypothetical protein
MGRTKVEVTDHQKSKILLLHSDGFSIDRISKSVNLGVGIVNRVIEENRMYDMDTESHFELPSDNVSEPSINETTEQKINRLASKVISINATLESIKPLYTELDQAVMELKDLIGLNNNFIEEGTLIGVQIVDEFAEKNTIWRIQKSQRYIAKLETFDERLRREQKAAKAAEKAAKALEK